MNLSCLFLHTQLGRSITKQLRQTLTTSMLPVLKSFIQRRSKEKSKDCRSALPYWNTLNGGGWSHPLPFPCSNSHSYSRTQRYSFSFSPPSNIPIKLSFSSMKTCVCHNSFMVIAGAWSRSWSPPESWFWPGVGVPFEGDSDSGPYLFHVDFCVLLFCCSLFGFCAIYFTTKLCLYTVVHLLLQEFEISLKSSLSAQWVL